jgi:two-component system, NarL family, nitrate/nitrite response regulator NarL
VVPTVKLALADKDAVLLDGLTAVLGQMGYEIVATAATRRDLLAQVVLHRPDICVTANHFPDGDSVEVIGQLCRTGTKVVVLTSDGNPDTMRKALDSGATGYVHNACGVDVLVDVLGRVADGDVVVAGTLPWLRQRTAMHTSADLLRLATYLTPREFECLALLTEGLDTAAMAERLGVSRATVRSHVQAVLTKLGVHSRLEAASLATSLGLVGARPDGSGP